MTEHLKMQIIKLIAILVLVSFLSACSFNYEVVIVNDSDEPIEVIYKITNDDYFDEPMSKTLEEWNSRKSIKRLWQEEKPWLKFPKDLFVTDSKVRQRVIKVEPQQVVRIETGSYNPIKEEEGRLSNISELRIVSENGEIIYKGKLLLNEFEKDGYTFIKTYKNELESDN